MSHLLDLPTEVREMIYKYCLLTSKTINPYRTKYHQEAELCFTQFTTSTQRPTIGLLAVNTTIREEASRVFYGKNQLRIPWDAEHPSSLALWGKHNAHFHHVVMDFAFRGILDADRPYPSPSFLPPEKRFRSEDWRVMNSHEYRVRDLLDKWQDKFRLLQDMRLKSLVIDLTDCWCPQACCRLVRRLCEEVLKRHILPKGLRSNPHRIFLIRLAEIKVKFVGIDEEEKAIVRSLGIGEESF